MYSKGWFLMYGPVDLYCRKQSMGFVDFIHESPVALNGWISLSFKPSVSSRKYPIPSRYVSHLTSLSHPEYLYQ